MNSPVQLPGSKVFAVILGTMQDGGLPHIGCRCPRCATAYANLSTSSYSACLAIVDNRQQPPQIWLIDATPDIKYQLNLLGDILGRHPVMPDRLRQPDGLFLTHAHMGHTAGLSLLGPEGMNVQNLTVYASDKLNTMLSQTNIWGPLVDNLSLVSAYPGKSIQVAPDLSITPISVNHRDETGVGTFAYLCNGPMQSLLYIPDIDNWLFFGEIKDSQEKIDVALVDATFFSRGELGGRENVAHPLVPDTIDFWSGSSTRLILTHLNHTNPILDPGSEARLSVDLAGVTIAETGQVIAL